MTDYYVVAVAIKWDLRTVTGYGYVCAPDPDTACRKAEVAIAPRSLARSDDFNGEYRGTYSFALPMGHGPDYSPTGIIHDAVRGAEALAARDTEDN